MVPAALAPRPRPVRKSPRMSSSEPPARTPEPIVRKLNAEIDRAMKTDELRAAVTGQGGLPLTGTPEAYDAYLQTEIARYAKVIGALNVKPE